MLVTIGLEVHTQLDTKTKIFCGCEVKFGSEPNSCVCPVCLGLPGVLPVMNRKVFLLGLRAVLAFGGTPSQRIKFDRKNYFYPDLPKGYQISQYDAPLGQGGFVEIGSGNEAKKIRLNRIHLEEDAGKLIHDGPSGASFVDLNRAGTPLIEIVTEPDLESPEDAHAYLTALKAVLKSIGVSECDMEKGHLRCDANVSVRKESKDPYGKRVEVKNMNSFRAVKMALTYEIKRQTEATEKGETLFQETRLWDEASGKTFTMRSKEEAHDYRYFPEPDLVPFSVTENDIKQQRAAIPELPKDRKERFVKEFSLSDYDAGLLVQDKDVADLFERATGLSKNAKAIANWIIGPVFAYFSEQGVELAGTKLNADRLAALQALVEKGTVSFQAAKEKILPDVIQAGEEPAALIEKKGLAQVSDDSALDSWIKEVLDENPKVVGDFKSGKETAAMFLVGQVMRKSKGKANPGKVQERVVRKLQER